MLRYVVSTGSELYGPFDTPEAASAYAAQYEEDLGDWFVQELYGPEPLG